RRTQSRNGVDAAAVPIRPTFHAACRSWEFRSPIFGSPAKPLGKLPDHFDSDTIEPRPRVTNPPGNRTIVGDCKPRRARRRILLAGKSFGSQSDRQVSGFSAWGFWRPELLAVRTWKKHYAKSCRVESSKGFQLPCPAAWPRLRRDHGEAERSKRASA